MSPHTHNINIILNTRRDDADINDANDDEVATTTTTTQSRLLLLPNNSQSTTTNTTSNDVMLRPRSSSSSSSNSLTTTTTTATTTATSQLHQQHHHHQSTNFHLISSSSSSSSNSNSNSTPASASLSLSSRPQSRQSSSSLLHILHQKLNNRPSASTAPSKDGSRVEDQEDQESDELQHDVDDDDVDDADGKEEEEEDDDDFDNEYDEDDDGDTGTPPFWDDAWDESWHETQRESTTSDSQSAIPNTTTSSSITTTTTTTTVATTTTKKKKAPLHALNLLPAEIIMGILVHLPSQQDRHALALVCRSTAAACMHALWRDPTITSPRALDLFLRTMRESRVYQSFRYFSIMDSFDIGAIRISDDDLFDLIGRTESLRRLVVKNSLYITSTSLARIPACTPLLNSLDIPGCERVEMRVLTDRLVATSRSLPHLRRLNLSRTRVTPTDVGLLIDAFPALTALRLTACRSIDDSVAPHLARATRLQELSVAETRITSPGLVILIYGSDTGPTTTTPTIATPITATPTTSPTTTAMRTTMMSPLAASIVDLDISKCAVAENFDILSHILAVCPRLEILAALNINPIADSPLTPSTMMMMMTTHHITPHSLPLTPTTTTPTTISPSSDTTPSAPPPSMLVSVTIGGTNRARASSAAAASSHIPPLLAHRIGHTLHTLSIHDIATDAATTLILSRAPNIRSLALITCAALTDTPLLSLPPHSLPRLTSVILRGCVRITDRGIIAIATAAAENLTSIDARRCALSDSLFSELEDAGTIGHERGLFEGRGVVARIAAAAAHRCNVMTIPSL